MLLVLLLHPLLQCGKAQAGAEDLHGLLQQSLNVEGLPFLLSPENEEYMQTKALKRLMTELDAGWKSAEQGRWVSAAYDELEQQTLTPENLAAVMEELGF